MSLITVSEARSLFRDKIPTNDRIYSLVAGVSDAFSIACNRMFAMRASEASVTDGKLRLLIPFHGLSSGQRVSIHIAGIDHPLTSLLTVESAGFGLHEFQVPVADALGDLCDAGVTVRPVQTEIHSTRGEPGVFVDRLPLASVVSVSTQDSDGQWGEIPEADYSVADSSGGLSFSGEIALASSYFPAPRLRRCWKPTGVQVEFIAGEPIVPSAVVQAVASGVKNANSRQGSSGMQTESLDYYSYSRMSPQMAAETFGEVLHTIRQFRIPAA